MNLPTFASMGEKGRAARPASVQLCLRTSVSRDVSLPITLVLELQLDLQVARQKTSAPNAAAAPIAAPTVLGPGAACCAGRAWNSGGRRFQYRHVPGAQCGWRAGILHATAWNALQVPNVAVVPSYQLSRCAPHL